MVIMTAKSPKSLFSILEQIMKGTNLVFTKQQIISDHERFCFIIIRPTWTTIHKQSFSTRKHR